MPELIKLLHGSAAGLAKIMNQFRRHWTAKCQAKGNVTDTVVEEKCQISKRQLERKIQAIATKERRSDRLRWYVHAHILSSYGLENSLGSESLSDAENEGRVSPLSTGLPKTPSIMQFVSPSQRIHNAKQVSPPPSLLIKPKSPLMAQNQEKAKHNDAGIKNTSEGRKGQELTSATSALQGTTTICSSVSVENHQTATKPVLTKASAGVIPVPMEVDNSHAENQAESSAKELGVKQTSLMAKLNRASVDRSGINSAVEMPSLTMMPLETKQSYLSHEVICID